MTTYCMECEAEIEGFWLLEHIRTVQHIRNNHPVLHGMMTTGDDYMKMAEVDGETITVVSTDIENVFIVEEATMEELTGDD